MSKRSMASFRLWIWLFSWLPSLVVTDAEITWATETRERRQGPGVRVRRPHQARPTGSTGLAVKGLCKPRCCSPWRPRRGCKIDGALHRADGSTCDGGGWAAAAAAA
eukprot:364708-Chlamydomonas_euryale.AAC.15